MRWQLQEAKQQFSNVADPLPVVDGLLAATARVHGLVLVTRNTDDFARTGVRLLNPFSGGPRV